MDKTQINKLASYCIPTQEGLHVQLAKELMDSGRKIISHQGYLYSPGSHPVLLVCHLDTVHSFTPEKIWTDKNRTRLWSDEGIGGDDRCGVYLIMEIIKQIDCHILFCHDEEFVGKNKLHGAEHFCKSDIRPDVKFIVEFDRRGRDDAVFYGCGNEDFVKYVTSYGFCHEMGTYSDISWIAPHLDIAAVNLSSGYYEAHTKNEYIVFDDLDSILGRAILLVRNAVNLDQFRYCGAVYCEYCDWCGRSVAYSNSKNGNVEHLCSHCERCMFEGAHEQLCADDIYCEMCQSFLSDSDELTCPDCADLREQFWLDCLDFEMYGDGYIRGYFQEQRDELWSAWGAAPQWVQFDNIQPK